MPSIAASQVHLKIDGQCSRWVDRGMNFIRGYTIEYAELTTDNLNFKEINLSRKRHFLGKLSSCCQNFTLFLCWDDFCLDIQQYNREYLCSPGPMKRYQLDFQEWQASRNNKHLDKYLHSTGQHNACSHVSLTAFFQCTPLFFIQNIYQATADFCSEKCWYNVFCLPSPLLTSIRNHFNYTSYFFQRLSPKDCLCKRHFHLRHCLKTISSNNYVFSLPSYKHFHWSKKLISSWISCVHRKSIHARDKYEEPIFSTEYSGIPCLVTYSAFLKSAVIAIAGKNARINPVF